MAVDFPSSVIREIQIQLRKGAGVPSYDPGAPEAPLPTLGEAIAAFDPSPPHLRCNRCRGSLLRGLQSLICVYCGAEQRRDAPPPPISFTSTFGYRRLLESLHADGSEAVAFTTSDGDIPSVTLAMPGGIPLTDPAVSRGTKDLVAKFGRGSSSSATPSSTNARAASGSRGVAVSSALVITPSEGARRRSPDRTRDGSSPRKKSKAGEKDSGAEQALKGKTPARAFGGKALPEKSAPASRTAAETVRDLSFPAGHGSGSASGPRAAPATWRPRLEIQPGKPLNLEDQVLGNPLVIGALAKACALPRDMEQHAKFDNESLLASAIQAALLNVQRLQLVVERSDKNVSRITQLEFEREKLRKELADLKKSNAKMNAQLEVTLVSITNLTSTTHQLRGEIWVKTKRLAELESELAKLKADSAAESTRQRAEVEKLQRENAKLKAQYAEVKRLQKENSDLKSSLRAEAQAAFKKGVDQTTEEYERQVEEITSILFEEGCLAALKQAGVPEDHPVYQNLPKYFGPEPKPSPAPPTENAQVEAPAADPFLDGAPPIPPADDAPSTPSAGDAPSAPPVGDALETVVSAAETAGPSEKQ